jgi:hypothetical protein
MTYFSHASQQQCNCFSLSCLLVWHFDQCLEKLSHGRLCTDLQLKSKGFKVNRSLQCNLTALARLTASLAPLLVDVMVVSQAFVHNSTWCWLWFHLLSTMLFQFWLMQHVSAARQRGMDLLNMADSDALAVYVIWSPLHGLLSLLQK